MIRCGYLVENSNMAESEILYLPNRLAKSLNKSF